MRKQINKWFFEQNGNANFFLQMFRYGSYGLITTGLCFVALFFFTEGLGLHYLLSNVLAFFVGLPLNYFFCKKFIFSNKATNPQVEFILYGVFSAFGLLIDSGALYVLTDLAGLYYMLSKVISSILVFLWNFGSRKLIYVFLKTSEA